MSANEEIEKLRKLINSSGFPLQLRVAQEIRQMTRVAGTVVSEEHPWRDGDTGEDGFIDVVIGCNTDSDLFRMILECKRSRDADWVFLVPDNARGTHVRCIWVSTHPENLHDPVSPRSGHHDFYIAPESYISQFCVVRGTGEGQRPMLENLCGPLLGSVESFAREELDLNVRANRSERRYYIPVVVTTARLHVCRFDVGSISLQEGEVPAGEFEEVPYLRFTKSLATELSGERQVNTILAANRDRHRTVLVVQAQHLGDLLTDWHLNIRERLPTW